MWADLIFVSFSPLHARGPPALSAIPKIYATFCLPSFTTTVYHPSSLSVCNVRHPDHIGWNTLKIISPPNSDKIVMWRFLRNRRVTLRLHTIFRALIYYALLWLHQVDTQEMHYPIIRPRESISWQRIVELNMLPDWTISRQQSVQVASDSRSHTHRLEQLQPNMAESVLQTSVFAATMLHFNTVKL